MNKLKLVSFVVMLTPVAAHAGGIITNTNQNIAFLRNPARDGAIGIDGVYSNPAGVAFLNEGFHLSLNIQNAHQTRTVTTAFGPLFSYNMLNPAEVNADGLAPRVFEGKAYAPVIPSIQAAYNKGKWSYQFGFAITGGGGKCEFPYGLGSFEGVVASLPSMAQGLNAAFPVTGMLDPNSPLAKEQIGNGYAFDSFMRGRQYYFGFTFGAAYKLTDNLSVYGGLRMLYGNSNYYGYVKNIRVESALQGAVNATEYFSGIQTALAQYSGAATANAAQAQAASDAYAAAGNTAEAERYKALATQLTAAAAGLNSGTAGAAQLAVATQDIELNCDQTGWGVAPIIGIDYKTGKFNFAVKYEFKTRMRLENKSANSASAKNIAMLDKFADGAEVAEDSPALLTVGAQYEILPSLRVMAGYHHYFDVDTKQYTKDMLGDTNEYLFGAEYDISKAVQMSAGIQKTDYGFKDAAMNDISFNVSSYTFGFGAGVNVTKKVKVNVAYFQTNYEDYNLLQTTAAGITKTDSFTRTNRVLGIGTDITF